MKIIYSPLFEREIKTLARRHRSIAQDFIHLVNDLRINPIQGKSLGKDCYKIRMAVSSKNKGKSGGARVDTCVKRIDDILYFLSIFDKSDKEDLDEGELDAILKSLGLKP